jgi:hypothetical protein
MLPAGHEVS